MNERMNERTKDIERVWDGDDDGDLHTGTLRHPVTNKQARRRNDSVSVALSRLVNATKQAN